MDIVMEIAQKPVSDNNVSRLKNCVILTIYLLKKGRRYNGIVTIEDYELVIYSNQSLLFFKLTLSPEFKQAGSQRERFVSLVFEQQTCFENLVVPFISRITGQASYLKGHTHA